MCSVQAWVKMMLTVFRQVGHLLSATGVVQNCVFSRTCAARDGKGDAILTFHRSFREHVLLVHCCVPRQPPCKGMARQYPRQGCHNIRVAPRCRTCLPLPLVDKFGGHVGLPWLPGCWSIVQEAQLASLPVTLSLLAGMPIVATNAS